jgi:hypothetical protein
MDVSSGPLAHHLPALSGAAPTVRGPDGVYIDRYGPLTRLIFFSLLVP